MWAGIRKFLNTGEIPLNELIEDSIAGNHGSAEFTTAGAHTWTCPEGVGLVYVVTCGGSGGGGGGGGGCYYTSSGSSGGGGGGGGGAAAAVVEAILPVSAGKTYNLIVGAGGIGGSGGSLSNTDKAAGTGGNGGAGGDTSFEDLLIAKGANGGIGGTGGTYSSDSGTAANRPGKGGNGGATLSSENCVSTKNIVISLFEAKDGENGNSGNYRWSVSTGGGDRAGGTSSKNITGIAGGNGGAGGDCQYNTVSNGSAGATGSNGYIKIFW